jgi:hypothetical protein
MCQTPNDRREKQHLLTISDNHAYSASPPMPQSTALLTQLEHYVFQVRPDCSGVGLFSFQTT